MLVPIQAYIAAKALNLLMFLMFTSLGFQLLEDLYVP
jgi:hypothetical protein